MTNNLSKYESFLNDEKVYLENIKFWENEFNNLLNDISYHKYFSTTFANGKDFFDGNPIFNFKVENSNKAVFIVQEQLESEETYFQAWIDKFETDTENLDKLVIVLELTEKSLYLTKELVKKWIIENKTVSELKIYIENFSEPIKVNGSKLLKLSELLPTKKAA